MTAEPPAKVAKVSKTEDDVQGIVEKIDDIQSELDALNDKAADEIIQVERKYNQHRLPLYEKRAADIATIQAFWVTAFINHPQISSLLSENDEEALSFLQNISVVENDDIKSGFKILFTFKENPFFTNTELVKNFIMTDMGEPRSTSTKINWKEGKSLLEANGTQTDSFFAWFDNSSGADEVGELIKDDLWPNPLQYYLATEGEMDDEEDGDDFEDGDDEEEATAEN